MSDLLNFFADEAGLLLDRTVEHLIICAVGMVAAIVIALPVGILLGHRHSGSFVAINISNVLRALPSLALIAISLAFFGLSWVNIQIALVALAIPPIIVAIRHFNFERRRWADSAFNPYSSGDGDDDE